MSERALEHYLCHRVHGFGGYALKNRDVAGFMDRTIYLPGGVTGLAELKTPTGGIRKAQHIWHARMAKIGFTPAFLRTRDEVDAYLESLLNA